MRKILAVLSLILSTYGTAHAQFGGPFGDVDNLVLDTDCSGYTTEGLFCWDTDNDFLYVGTGSGVSAVGAGGSGDMTKAVYDVADDGSADTANALKANGANAAAGSAILGVDASGAAEGAFDVWTEAENTAAGYINGNSPTINTPTLTLTDGNGAAPTADGSVKYDRTTERLQVGDGATTKEFYPGAIPTVNDTPTNGETTVAASSNSVYDHAALTLLSHGIADTSKLTTNAAAIPDNAVCRGDGGANGVQKSGILVDDADLMTFPATAGAGIFLPEENDAATPTLSFGTGEGIYSVGDALFFSIAGAQKIVFSGTKFQMAVTDGPQLSIAGSTSTSPNILPDYIDTDTGIGHDGSGNTDKLSLIAGGREVERLIEDTYTAKQLMPSTGNTHGGYITRIFASTSGALTGATDTIPLAIPAGWRITQCQLHVKTIVVDSAGDDTWSSELNDGAQEEIISAGSAAAANTNINHWADADAWGTYTDAETNILLTPNGGEFSSGEIEAHCLAYGFDNWDNE